MPNLVSVGDPRLHNSRALLRNPFKDGDVLDNPGGKNMPLKDKVFVLANVHDGNGHDYRVAVDHDTPVALFNDPLADAVRGLGGTVHAVMSPKDPTHSIKFQTGNPLSPIGGGSIIFVQTPTAPTVDVAPVMMLRRDGDIPAASMPNHLMLAGGFWDGGRLSDLPVKEQSEEMYLLQVDAVSATGLITAVTHLRFDRGQNAPGPSVLKNLTKWHGQDGGKPAVRRRDVALTNVKDPRFSLKNVFVTVDGKKVDGFPCVAEWERYSGKLGDRDFDGPMNVLSVMRVGLVSLGNGGYPATSPLLSPLLSGDKAQARRGDLVVVDGEGFGRAGGLVRPLSIPKDQPCLPAVRALQGRLGALRA